MIKKIVDLFFVVSVCFLLVSCNESSSPEYTLINGESFSLRGSAYKEFLFEAEYVLSVYAYDEVGNKILYTKDDYEFNSELNSIRRTLNSRIPDFNTHNVTFNENGTFSFNGIPRNPPLINLLQIYIDYESRTLFKPINNKSILQDNNLDGIIDIYVYGDSIASGAQTYSQYFNGNDSDSFVGLLRRYLNVDKSINVINKSENGQVSDYFYNDYQKAITDGADLFIIEFGMNDHIQGTEGLNNFISNINDAVISILNSGNDVVIVGFFQQNVLWDRENTIDTIEYNEALKNIADNNNVPFVDIYNLYNNLFNKYVIEDITADWMHHPNNFGHKLYFSSLLPYFLLNNNEISISYYIGEPIF